MPRIVPNDDGAAADGALCGGAGLAASAHRDGHVGANAVEAGQRGPTTRDSSTAHGTRINIPGNAGYIY